MDTDELNELNKDKTFVLDFYINDVKRFLNHVNVEVPFYVAGGSIFSILNNCNATSYTDIDVYFYNETDAKLVNNAILNESSVSVLATTSNAMTIRSNPKPLQFIFKYFGDTNDIFDSFDFNCSRVAYTSDNKLIKCRSFSKFIQVPEVLYTNILSRYHKYINKKGAVDDSNVLYKIYDALIKNVKQPIYDYYEELSTTHGVVLNNEITLLSIGPECQYLHDELMKNYTSFDARKEIFDGISKFNSSVINEPALELTLYRYQTTHRDKHNYITSKDLTRAKNKYPEYFL